MSGRDPRVTAIRTMTCDTGQGRSFVFVLVDTDVGLTGVGEASQNDQDAAVVKNVEQLAGRYIGSSIFQLIERCGQFLKSPRTGRAIFAAASAIEQALWDLMGKALDRPVFELLGGACRSEVPCYATLGAAISDYSTVDSLVAEARGCILNGFTGVKITPFRGWPSTPLSERQRRIQEGVDLVGAVRSGIGPDRLLLIECSFSFAPADAAEVARRLAPYDCFWLEAPLNWDDPAELSRLRSQSSSRIASGETGHGRVAYRDLISQQAVDVIQPDVKWTGGILEAKKIAAWAEAFQLGVACHNNSGPIATAASAHLSLTLPNALLLEAPARRPEWEDDLTAGSSLIGNGVVTAAQLALRPGLGVSFDEAVAAMHST